MIKQEVELIILKVVADGQEALNMKIYKNGTTCRSGVGGLPQLGISGMSFFNHSKFFDELMGKVPQEILDKPINYAEETPNGYLEFIVAFYGVSSNGDTGERAKWTQSTGVRVKLDHQTTLRHPIMSFLDTLVTDAAELTNDWYFDVIMNIVYNAKSSTLPNESILSAPNTPEAIRQDYENYVSQMLQSMRKWDMKKYVENKHYEIHNTICKGVVMQQNNAFSVTFVPEGGSDAPTEKRKWKLW